MKRKFKDVRFQKDSAKRIELCNQIIEDYQEQGLRLTLRQMYYQLVSRNVISNLERSYKNLSSLVSDARLAGLMDWDAIEDRIRVPRKPSEFDNLSDLVNVAVSAYRLPRWADQDNYVELWVEKDALAGVLAPIANQYHITLLVNRGYSSQSAMYESAERFKINLGKTPGSIDRALYLLYLGDHDPSGEDMVRDVRDRFEMFGVYVIVQKVALTMAQIEEYDPPPNPAKVSDPRAKAYIEKFGDESWEVDALPPEVLTRIITTELDRLVDKKKMDAIKKREESDKRRLRAAAGGLIK